MALTMVVELAARIGLCAPTVYARQLEMQNSLYSFQCAWFVLYQRTLTLTWPRDVQTLRDTPKHHVPSAKTWEAQYMSTN
jgi:hypothetical protein